MTTLFRVENLTTLHGLWYNDDGTFTEYIKKMDGAQSADLPMGFDPEFRRDGNWVSACDNLPDMKNWFSSKDLSHLSEVGYGLYAYEVTLHRDLNGHQVFRREDVVSFRPMPIAILD